MPELPEVETVCNALKKRADQSVIKQFTIYNSHLRWEIDPSISSKVTNKKINHIKRRGKYIVLHFDTGYLILHLGMTGVIQLTSSKKKITKHDHFDIELQDKLVLRFNDVRKFGSVHWAELLNKHFLIENLGPEPLSRMFTTDYLMKVAKRRKVTIKDLIMNQKVVVGIGNIYATEALFLSGIRPSRKCHRLTKMELTKLINMIKKTLRNAIKVGGTSISDFKNLEGELGYFAQKLNIYGLKKCKKCKSDTHNIVIAGRSSYFCKKCQR